MAMKVTFLGGYGCGKTSALASMLAQSMTGALREMSFEAAGTIFNFTEQAKLCDKIPELIHYLEHHPKDIFMMDGRASSEISTYTLRLMIPGSTKHLNLDFTDVPGSMLNFGRRHNEMMDNIIKDSDVVVVAIDTPYLMECEECIAGTVNLVPEITDLLSYNCYCESERSSKMVMFMPVKCEKWVNEGKIEEVNNRIKSLYSPLINSLKQSQYVSICILPVQAIGNIEFVEMQDAYIVKDYTNSNYMRCAKLSDDEVRLQNGELHVIRETDELSPDPSALRMSDRFPKPNAWYAIRKNPTYSVNNELYNPHNCDQLLLHILRFWAMKILSIPHILGILPVQGTDLADAIMTTLFAKGCLKYNEDGIEYLKSI